MKPNDTVQRTIEEYPPHWSQQLWWVLTLASLITLSLWLRPSSGFQLDWTATIFGTLLIAFLVNFQIPVGRVPTTLAHAISLPLGMALGPGSAGIVLASGITIGEFIYAMRQRRRITHPPDFWTQVKRGALIFSRQVLSISGASINLQCPFPRITLVEPANITLYPNESKGYNDPNLDRPRTNTFCHSFRSIVCIS
jgi:hypothetical protein